MRLVVGLFAMFLTASVAHADEAKTPEPKPEVTRTKVPLRVVRMLPESHQALLFDRTRGTHVLAEVGETVEGYTVEDIDDDEVTLSANGKEVVLAAPDPSWRRRDDARTEAGTVRAAKKVVAKAEIAPVDPYAEPVADAPIDPYAEPAVRAVDAPAAISAGEGGMRVASASPVSAAAPDPYADLPAPAAPTAAAPKAAAPSTAPAFVPPGTPAAPTFVPPGTPAQTRAPVAPATVPASPATTAAPVTAAAPAAPAVDDAPPAPVITPTVLSRSELNASLADFTKLASVLRGSFTPTGARLDAVAEGSVFAKAGLRNGDIVTAVDGTPLKTIDDAADLYVRASATRAANIQLIRAGKPLTLRVLLQ